MWFWDFEDNKMYYELEDPVRFRVKNVKFSKPPSVQELRNKAGEDDMSGTAAKPIAVMQVSPFATYHTCFAAANRYALASKKTTLRMRGQATKV